MCKHLRKRDGTNAHALDFNQKALYQSTLGWLYCSSYDTYGFEKNLHLSTWHPISMIPCCIHGNFGQERPVRLTARRHPLSYWGEVLGSNLEEALPCISINKRKKNGLQKELWLHVDTWFVSRKTTLYYHYLPWILIHAIEEERSKVLHD